MDPMQGPCIGKTNAADMALYKLAWDLKESLCLQDAQFALLPRLDRWRPGNTDVLAQPQRPGHRLLPQGYRQVRPVSPPKILPIHKYSMCTLQRVLLHADSNSTFHVAYSDAFAIASIGFRIRSAFVS